MNYRNAYERVVNVTASRLDMVAQRLPLIKNLTPIFGATGGSLLAAPLAVTFVGTHALSGQSIMLQQTNTSEPTDVVEIEVGEAFQWEFKATRYNILSFSIIDDNGNEQLPPESFQLDRKAGSEQLEESQKRRARSLIRSLVTEEITKEVVRRSLLI